MVGFVGNCDLLITWGITIKKILFETRNYIIDVLAVSALWHTIVEIKQRWSVTGPLGDRALEGTLNRWSRLQLQSLAHTNPHWARVIAYGPFSLCVFHKERLCPSSGDNSRLMVKGF
jgi:hypothetical protein